MARLFPQVLVVAAVAGCQAVSPYSPIRYAGLAETGTIATPKAAEIADPPDPPDPLSLAADCLERGDENGAVAHLRKHVAAHPDQVVFRAQLAELLVRLDRLAEAQSHFESAAALAQSGSIEVKKSLIHYHTRLMEIARLRGDGYAEHLHRGIGLYHVAVRLSSDGNNEDVEGLLCKSAGALKEAQNRRPDDGRCAWYLYRVWTQLDQPRPAEKALRKAIANASFADLTAAEAQELAAIARPVTTIR